MGGVPQPPPNMNLQVQDPAQEVKRLQRCINDLVSLLALPAVWSGNEPSHIVQILLDALLRTLNLDFVCARLKDPADAGWQEILRVSDLCKLRIPPQDISRAIDSWFGAEDKRWSPASRPASAEEGIQIS